MSLFAAMPILFASLGFLAPVEPGTMRLLCPDFAHYCELEQANGAFIRMCYDDRAPEHYSLYARPHSQDMLQYDPSCDVHIVLQNQYVTGIHRLFCSLTREYEVREADGSAFGTLALDQRGRWSLELTSMGASGNLIDPGDTQPWYVYGGRRDMTIYLGSGYNFLGSRLVTPTACPDGAPSSCVIMGIESDTLGYHERVLGALVGLHLRTFH